MFNNFEWVLIRILSDQPNLSVVISHLFKILDLFVTLASASFYFIDMQRNWGDPTRKSLQSCRQRMYTQTEMSILEDGCLTIVAGSLSKQSVICLLPWMSARCFKTKLFLNKPQVVPRRRLKWNNYTASMGSSNWAHGSQAFLPTTSFRTYKSGDYAT